jgi:hypothetical protein
MMEIPKFTQEEEAAFGALQAAFANICEELGAQKMNADVIRAIMERLVREALGRARANRRMAYLEQFREFLCPLPDAMKMTADESQRRALIRHRIQDFRMKDAKGRKNAGGSIPSSPGWTKRWAERDGELWEAEVLSAEAQVEPATFVDHAELQKFMVGIPIHQESSSASQYDPSKIRFIRPLNLASVLLKGFDSLYPNISELEDLRSPDVREKNFPDVPEAHVRRWMGARTPTAADLALLVAAYRAKMTSTLGNLSTLRSVLAGARWAKDRSGNA